MKWQLELVFRGKRYLSLISMLEVGQWLQRCTPESSQSIFIDCARWKYEVAHGCKPGRNRQHPQWVTIVIKNLFNYRGLNLRRRYQGFLGMLRIPRGIIARSFYRGLLKKLLSSCWRLLVCSGLPDWLEQDLPVAFSIGFPNNLKLMVTLLGFSLLDFKPSDHLIH